MIYEITNPSEAYTMEADCFSVACGACLVLSPALGLRSEDGSQEMPPLLFGDPLSWFREQFGIELDNAFINEQRSEIAKCLFSVVIGTFHDRKTYAAAIELIDDPAKRVKFSAEWHDARLNSTYDIRRYAYKLAARIAAESSQEVGASQQEATASRSRISGEE